MHDKNRGSFKSRIGFVLSAAGSAVGLGNLWRFPYLAAKNGGGLFIFIYIFLAFTFGFSLLTTEIAIGRKTGKSPINAFMELNKKSAWIGYFELAVPMIILPYYSVIGGWVFKYTYTYLIGNGSMAVDSTGGFFHNVIGLNTNGIFQLPSVFWFLLFMGLTAVFVYLGVDKGIEKCSKILMPILIILILFISAYSLTLKDSLSGRTALDGLKIYLTPNFEGMTVLKFLRTFLDAAGQLFYSMSIAMGIMITYGSYSNRKSSLLKSVKEIEIFDTGVALFSGLIMVPAVFCFLGNDGLSKAGPSLMFIALPQVFNAMGTFGNIIGVLFFFLVIFAAITSSISIMEAIVSMIMDRFNLKRSVAATITLIISAIIGLITCLGYNALYFDIMLPNGTHAQVLDLLDYIANNLLMPIVSAATCILVGWFVGIKKIADEVTRNGEKFTRRGLYSVMTKYICPIILIAIFLNSFGLFDNILK